MTTYTLEIHTDQAISDLEKLERNFNINLEDVLDEVADKVGQEMAHQAPKMTGALAESIDVIEKSPKKRSVGPGGSRGSQSRPLPKAYAVWVEEGAPAHFPNVSDIANRYGVDEQEAFLIARKISERPTAPTRFAETTKVKAEKMFEDTINRMITLLIR